MNEDGFGRFHLPVGNFKQPRGVSLMLESELFNVQHHDFRLLNKLGYAMLSVFCI
ncbi:hypothetical protein Q7C_2494 [Methylophaga frappieri]|uniref:Uncharacterized protein n=1 Tax=Methylophaga frappieri (strain ATCC BAA-2434 / DSM 25690 / JAM7) TaxID=754477 RepID=I1YL26_METFJ|nr:hypothetical protein Q7C_2494 [Methylophaga frappieri]